MTWVNPNVSIYGNVKTGDRVRIDNYSILTGDIEIGNNVHIGCYVFLSGQHGIILEDYVQISAKVVLLSGSDDYSGNSLVGPTIPAEFKPHMQTGKIIIERHALIGAGSVVMPGVTIGEGVAVGAMSFVNKSLEPWGVYAGIPAKRIKDRSKKMLELQVEYEQSLKGNNE